MFDPGVMDLVGTVVAALLTVMVLSYILGDSWLFRLATHIFVGVAAGYAGTIAWHSVLEPRLVDPILAEGFGALRNPVFLIGWVLVLLILLKISPKTARYGSLPVAFMAGVAAAAVVGGSITGTLVPQSWAAMSSLDPGELSLQTGEAGWPRVINTLITLVGTISTLMYFRFSLRRDEGTARARSMLGRAITHVGRFFIGVTFGAMYAGALMAAIVVLVERIQFLRDVLFRLMVG